MVWSCDQGAEGRRKRCNGHNCQLTCYDKQFMGSRNQDLSTPSEPLPPTQRGQMTSVPAPAAAAKHITTNDGVRLEYEQAGDAGPVVILIHGWSGSRRYFCRNLPALAARCRCFAYDQRFHGGSDSPSHGYHVSRLAADLRDFMAALELRDVTVVGSSMGAAVIWSYVELFGTDSIRQAVFVDQAPLQNRARDWQLGSKGCNDPASLASLQDLLERDLAAVADGNAAGCLSLPLPEDVAAVLKAETLRCDPRALGLLMADHTAADWRPVLPLLASLPCLNCVGGQSGCFPPEGCLEVARLVGPACCSVVFSRANHWLYLEQPEEFNELLLGFVERGNTGRAAVDVVNESAAAHQGVSGV